MTRPTVQSLPANRRSAAVPVPFSRPDSGGRAGYRLVVIDDETSVVRLVTTALANRELEIHGASEARAGLDLVTLVRPHIVLLDLMLPGVRGLELLNSILNLDPGINVILMTAHYSSDSAIEAIQQGACDCLPKPFQVDRLHQKVDRWIAEAQLRRKTFELDIELLRAFQLEGIVGRSPLMLDLFSRIRSIAPHFQTALISGDTGSGKELVARALHRLSPAAAGPFVVCNCSAIVETLLESELFGHTRGAFTGATQDRHGLVQHAQGGTLFLDEIGELALAAQAKLLRVLQSREVRRVGSNHAQSVNVRVVAATNRDLRKMVAEGAFREDLHYRLSMIEVKLPRLRERPEDLPLLERHFLNQAAERYGKTALHLTRRAQAFFARYPWPGNVREMENVIGYCAMVADREVIDVGDLPEYLRGWTGSRSNACDDLLPLEEVERRHVLRVLDHARGNRLRAAEILGISRATLYRLLSSWSAQAAQR